MARVYIHCSAYNYYLMFVRVIYVILLLLFSLPCSNRSSSFQQAMTVDVVLMDSMVADVGNNGQVAKNKDE